MKHHFLSLLAVLSLATLLAACDKKDPDSLHQYELYPPLADKVHPRSNKVIPTIATHKVHFSEYGDALAPDQRAHLNTFFRDVEVAATDRVTIDWGRGVTPDEKKVLIRQLRSQGVAMRNIQQRYVSELGWKTASMTAHYAIVIPPDCPDWEAMSTNNYHNVMHQNYGCANHMNLGQMVARPSELLGSEGRVLASPSRSNVVIDTMYNSGADLQSSGGESSGSE